MEGKVGLSLTVEKGLGGLFQYRGSTAMQE
jgi:hypothetical protein